jgi:cell division protein ZapA
MGELSIKINIANRVYPLTVKTEEEEGIRKTARMINDRIRVYEQDYAVKDKQDLLAMCALEFGTSNDFSLGQFSETEELLSEVKSLNERIKEVLSPQ